MRQSLSAHHKALLVLLFFCLPLVPLGHASSPTFWWENEWDSQFQKFHETFDFLAAYGEDGSEMLQESYAIAKELPELARDSFGPHDENLVISYQTLATLHRMGVEPPEKGREFHKKVLSIYETHPERDPIKVAGAARDLGDYVRFVLHEYEEALEHLTYARELIEEDMKDTGETNRHLEALIDTLEAKAHIYKPHRGVEGPEDSPHLRNPETRLALHEEQLALLERRYGTHDDNLVSTLWSLARVHLDQENDLEAVRKLRRAYLIDRQVDEEGHSRTAVTLNLLAEACASLGPAGLVEELEPKPQRAREEISLGDTMLSTGKKEERDGNRDIAIGYYFGALQSFGSVPASEAPPLDSVVERLAEMLREEGAEEDAAAVEEWFLEYLKAPPEVHESEDTPSATQEETADRPDGARPDGQTELPDPPTP